MEFNLKKVNPLNIAKEKLEEVKTFGKTQLNRFRKDASLPEVLDVVIVGAGAAAFAAAVSAAEQGLKTLLIKGDPEGGKLRLNPEAKNIFPTIKEATNKDIEHAFKKHLTYLHLNREAYGLWEVSSAVTKVEEKESGIQLQTEDQKTYTGKYLVIATGSQMQEGETEGLSALKEKGRVYFTATCAPKHFRNQKVTFVGEENKENRAYVYLLGFFASSITLVSQKPWETSFLEKQSLEILAPATITAAREREEENTLEFQIQKGKEKENITITADSLILAQEQKPNTDFVASFITRDNKGFIVVSPENRTSKKQVFAIGDCTNRPDYSLSQTLGSADQVITTIIQELASAKG